MVSTTNAAVLMQDFRCRTWHDSRKAKTLLDWQLQCR